MNVNTVIVAAATTGGMAHQSQNAHLPTRPEETARDVVVNSCTGGGVHGGAAAQNVAR